MKLVPAIALDAGEHPELRNALSHRWLFQHTGWGAERCEKAHLRFNTALERQFLTDGLMRSLRSELAAMYEAAQSIAAAPEVLDDLMTGIALLGEASRMCASMQGAAKYINGVADRDHLMERLTAQGPDDAEQTETNSSIAVA